MKNFCRKQQITKIDFIWVFTERVTYIQLLFYIYIYPSRISNFFCVIFAIKMTFWNILMFKTTLGPFSTLPAVCKH